MTDAFPIATDKLIFVFGFATPGQINVAVAKLVKFGKLPVSLQAGVGYWAESPEAGPEGFRFRLQANIVLPR